MDCHAEHWTESEAAFGAVTGQWIDGPNRNQYIEHCAEIGIQSFAQQSMYIALGNIRTSEALTMLGSRHLHSQLLAEINIEGAGHNSTYRIVRSVRQHSHL